MTNLEAIKGLLGKYPVSDKKIETNCQLSGIDPKEDYDANSKDAVKTALNILAQLLSFSGVSEGGVSLSFDKDGLKAYIRFLCIQKGFDSSDYINEPTVTRLDI